jgi:hypothetical protein
LTTLAFSQVRKPDAIFVPTPGNAVQERLIQIPRIARPPVLEEFLGGGSRSDMKRVDDFRQRNPGDGVPASQKTSAWLGYDDRSFYVVFVCHAPPGEIRARLAKREDIFSDDFVGVILDTYHDRQRGYLFLANLTGHSGRRNRS